VWRVKLVAELQPGVTTETEVALIERTEEAGLGRAWAAARRGQAADSSSRSGGRITQPSNRTSLRHAKPKMAWCPDFAPLTSE
jgi:hypothetical protein